MKRRIFDDPDQRLVTLGWWFVCAPAIVIFLAIIWAPIVLLGVHWIFQEGGRGLPIAFAAFVVAALADRIWRVWARGRWKRWAYGRAEDLDVVKARAMLDGVIPKDRAFLEQLASAGPKGNAP